jgi:hypothetical protein
MKRWKVTFGLFLLLLALATTVAYVETREEKMELEGKRVIFTQPRGGKIHFSYDAPENYVVKKWLWHFAYTDGHGSFGSGSNGDEYGATHFETETP